MAEFAYNNAKNASTGYTLFKLNCGFHLWAFYEEDVNPRSQLKLTNELATEFRELMAVYKKNLQHAQEFQKRYHNKHTKFKTHVLGNKV